MILGQVVTSSKVFSPLKFFNKVNGEFDKSIPTIIIGRKEVEKFYPNEKIKVLNKNLEPNVRWTFSKVERRSDYESDVDKFYAEVFKSLSKKVKYTYFNIFIESISKIKRFINFMENGGKKYIYFSNNNLYIYSNGIVVGFSLNDTEYIGISSEKVLSKIKSNPDNIIFSDTDFIPNNVKKYISTPDIMAPYLYFLSEN